MFVEQVIVVAAVVFLDVVVEVVVVKWLCERSGSGWRSDWGRSGNGRSVVVKVVEEVIMIDLVVVEVVGIQVVKVVIVI